VISDNLQNESFEDFKNSFSYGSRTDLNFKFLKALPKEEAAKFFQDLLWKLGASFDDGNFERLVEHVYQWQIRAYNVAGAWTYDTCTFTPAQKPISESRLALVTSTGHFVEGDDPEPFGITNMTQEEAISKIDDFLKTAPVLSSIPFDTPQQKLKARHPGYDIRGVQRDPNVAFPIERLRELQQEGIIGELTPSAYSFVGATAQTPLIKKVGPKWVKLLKEQQVNVALLVPV